MISFESAISTILFLAAVYALAYYPNHQSETAGYMRIKIAGDFFEILEKGASKEKLSQYLKEEKMCYKDEHKNLGECPKENIKTMEYIYYDEKDKGMKKAKIEFS